MLKRRSKLTKEGILWVKGLIGGCYKRGLYWETSKKIDLISDMFISTGEIERAEIEFLKRVYYNVNRRNYKKIPKSFLTGEYECYLID